MVYAPSEEILLKYADVFVNFGLNKGKGINKGEVVRINLPEIAKPLLFPLQESVLRSGGHPIINYIPFGKDRNFLEHANEDQINFFANKFYKGLADQLDHSISIFGEVDPKELSDIDPKKIMASGETMKPYSDWQDEKIARGKFSWTLGLYGTEGQAKEANMSLEEYWEQIINACYLTEENPVQKWKEINDEVNRVASKLSNLNIESLLVESNNTELTVGIGKGRKWLGGEGYNIPSFEVFTSPNYHMTKGHIKFNQPLYAYGNLIEDIFLKFDKGEVVEYGASKGEDLLKGMIETPGANRIGEFSLTDSRLSKITRFMADTLYDENIGGKFGNTHLALGNAYKECYPGDFSEISDSEWEILGYNDSSVHKDIVSTEDRQVTASSSDGSRKVIYVDGKFTI